VLTARLRVVHRLPSASRLEEYVVPAAFRACAARPRGEVLSDPSIMLSAMATMRTESF